MTSLRILHLAPQLPWPLDTGGKIRTYHLLQALSRQHAVRLLTFGEQATDATAVAALEALGVSCELYPRTGHVQQLEQLARGFLGPLPYNLRKYSSKEMRQRVLDLARSRAVDLIHCDHLHTATYGPECGLPFVVDEHNVETLIWERFARDASQPLPKRLLFRQQLFWLRRQERALCSQASLVLVCSAADRRVLCDLLRPHIPATQVVPNGVDVEYFGAEGPSMRQGHVFFTGSMDWAPNENAVLSFLEEIWPEMRRRCPDLCFAVVGRNPSPRLAAWHGSQGVQVTGTVPDVRPFMRGALALLVPMRVGGGTRLKILEAFAARVPVISTAVGIEGIEATPGVHYLRAETGPEFATCAERLRVDPGLAARLAEEASQLARERYSWSAVGRALSEEYSRRFAKCRPTGSPG